MKKLLLIALLAVAVSGCKKDDSSDQNGIIGTWTKTTDVIEYYNSSNVKVFTETAGSNEGIRTVTFNANGQAVIIGKDNSVDNSNYLYFSEGGKNYVSFDNQSVSDFDKHEVIFPTSTTMQLYVKENNVTYGDGPNAYLAAYAEIKISFTK